MSTVTSLSTPKEATTALVAGSIIAYPTEAVYGLGCNPYDEVACQKLAQLKARQDGAGWICVIGALSHLDFLTDDLPPLIVDQLKCTWPGPTTWVLPASPELPQWLLGPGKTIAVRYSVHPTVQALCEAFEKPIISTSANLKGEPPALNLYDLRRYFDTHEVPVIVEGSLGGAMRPSKILTSCGQTLRD